MEYQDYELLVTSDNTIRARSEGRDAAGEFLLDLDEIDLALQLVERRKTNKGLLKTLGDRLYRALFPPSLLAHFKASQSRAGAQGCGLRIRLNFEPPELSALCWELLYEEETNTFLACSPQTVISHYIPVNLDGREPHPYTPPSKILLVISMPSDLKRLRSEEEELWILNALDGHRQRGQVEIDKLSQATLSGIRFKLSSDSYNVFHFIGHASFKGEGCIYFLDEEAASRDVDEETFSNLFLGSRNMGLVVLNACKGASISSHRTFAGLAPNLVRRGIPAVVAMRYQIADTSATLFADEFYRALSEGSSVDSAVQAARNAILIETGPDLPDFATPVLFLRSKEGTVLNSLDRPV